MGRRLEKNYLFCEPCFLSLFRPLFVRYIYRKYPTYISDKLCSKSDQKTRAKQVGYFRLIYWTNCALSRTKKHAQNKSDISDLYIGQIVPQVGPKNTRKTSRIFPTYISDKLCPMSDQKTRAKQVGYFRLIYRTNCAPSRTKKHAQNKSDISDLYIGQIVP